MAQSPQWTISDWDPSSVKQERAMLALEAADHYPAPLLTPEYFDWQYRRNPAGQALIKLALEADTGRVNGQYVVLPWDVSINGKRVPFGLSTNTLIAQDFRGLGLIFVLSRDSYRQCADRGIHYLIGYPNPNFHAVSIRFLKNRDIGEIPLLIRVLRLSSTVRKRFPVERLRPILAPLAAVGNFVFSMRGPRHPAAAEVRQFDASYDEFNDQLARRFPIMVSRHAEFLNWRFIQAPLGYTILEVREAGRVQGYVVYRVMDYAGMKCGMVVDFLVRGDESSARVGGILLRSALADLMERGCDIAGSLCRRGGVEYGLLRKHWFIDCPLKFKPQPFAFIGYKMETDFEPERNPLDEKNWLVTMGDYDAV